MPEYYTVKGGESWASIARDVLGNERAMGELMAANGGGFNLRPGTPIVLPSQVSKNPFISDELAAATGMATSSQISRAYDTGGQASMQKQGASYDWRQNPQGGQQNQLWAALHARPWMTEINLNGQKVSTLDANGKSVAGDLQYGDLPDTFKNWLNGMSGTTFGSSGDTTAEGKAISWGEQALARGGDPNIGGKGPVRGGDNSQVWKPTGKINSAQTMAGINARNQRTGDGGLSQTRPQVAPAMPNISNVRIGTPAKPSDIILNALTMFNNGNTPFVPNEFQKQTVRPTVPYDKAYGDRTYELQQKAKLMGPNPLPAGDYRSNVAYQDYLQNNPISRGAKSFVDYLKNVQMYDPSKEEGNKLGPNSPINITGANLGGQPKVTPRTMAEPTVDGNDSVVTATGESGFSALAISNIRRDRELGIGSYGLGGPNGAGDQGQDLSTSVADMLLQNFGGIGPEIWRLDWTSIRQGANIQPYGYDREWSSYDGGGGGYSPQQYQQNYNNPYGYENQRVNTG
jgi:hypothetical protein